MTTMTITTMRKLKVVQMKVGGYMRRLEIVQKEVGGCLISYNLQLACVRKLEVIRPDARALSRRSLKLIIISHSVSPLPM